MTTCAVYAGRDIATCTRGIGCVCLKDNREQVLMLIAVEALFQKATGYTVDEYRKMRAEVAEE